MKPIARLLALGGAILLVSIAGVAASVKVDFDHNVDFSHFKTFAFQFFDGQITLEEKAPLLHQDILATITKNLEAEGLKKVDKDPDIYLTYHVTADNEATIHTQGYGYEPGAGWGAGYGWNVQAWGIETSTVSTYQEGSLIVDAFSARTKKAVWRGAGHGIIKGKVDDADKEVTKWINKMFEKWIKQHDELLEGEGKKD